MAAYAVVDNGVVVNTVLWDGKNKWKPEAGVAVLAPEVINIGWLYDGETFTAPPEPPKTKEELLAEAERKRRLLLAEADQITSDWKTELALGILEDDDKETLTKWMKYIRAVKAVDVSTAPDIKWPGQPEK